MTLILDYNTLKAANFLIKNAVQEEEQKMEKVKKHLETLEEVRNNVALLEEMLRHYDPGQSAAGDLEMIKVRGFAKETKYF